MTEGDALLRAILLNPADDAARLVYADFLDEHGASPDRTEMIRWGCAFPDCHGVCLCCDPRERPCRRCGAFACPVLDAMKRSDGETHYVDHRGFVREVRVTAEVFLKHIRDLFRRHPIEAVALTGMEPYDLAAVEWRWAWYPAVTWEEASDRLPLPIFELLDGGEYGGKMHRTREDALAALSRACVKWGRRQAGLPPLRP